MVEPRRFLSNPQTAESNTHQMDNPSDTASIQENALAEHKAFQALLKDQGINISLFEGQANTPDDLFCNNWIITHEDNTYSLFPMMAANRRNERRQDILESLPHQLAIDYTRYEQQETYLEGTGSMVLDRENKMAYAALSPRTHADMVTLWGENNGYEALTFQAYDNQGKPEYHTNVIMFVGSTLAGVCFEMVDEANRDKVRTFLSKHHAIMELTREQVLQFAGNALEVKNSQGRRFLVMSKRGYSSLDATQKQMIRNHVDDVITPDLTTIENYGGGSARCLMLEVF
jgi:hypothetical protein